MTLSEFRDALAAHNCQPTGSGRISARCPAHEDNRASLSVNEASDGKVLLHCHSGCEPEAICTALGIALADLFPATPRRNGGRAEPVATYDYRDEGGSLLFQVCRFQPKDFRQRKPDGSGGWTWSLEGVRRVLYRLPETKAAMNRGDVIYIAEGEKDVAALVRAGFAATCNAGGAGKWQDSYTATLSGAPVVIIADKDAPGRKHAADVAEKLQGTAASVKVVELPYANGQAVKDAADYFAAGGTAAAFKAICQRTPEMSSKLDKQGQADAVVSTIVDTEHASELEFARRLAACLPPVKTIGKTWHLYRTGAWHPLNSDTLKPQALKILPEPIRTIRRANTLLEHVEAEHQTDPDSFRGFHLLTPEGAVLVNAHNGIVKVSAEAVELLPHSPDHAFTYRTAAQFNPDAHAALFERVLGEVLPDPDDRELFQLCTGNFLFPDCRFETALCCYGEAGRGKSTVADPVVSALGMDLVCRLSMSQVCDPRSYHLPKLKFAAVNLGTELTTADIAESGNFKTLVSGEPIEARPIYGAPFVMQTACKLWFLANSLPRFRHGTEAELRRTRFIRFDYLPPVKDVTLKARLAAEADGVFLFIVRGLQRLLSCREIPLGGRESRAVHDRFRVSNDPVGSFVQCRCSLGPEARVPKEDLRNAFSEFAQRHELPAVCGEWFFRVLFERFPSLRETQPRVDGERARFIQGIGLRSYATTSTSE